MKSVLIADTTMDERIEIIRKWIPADEAMDENDIDLWDFYDDYIKGKKGNCGMQRRILPIPVTLTAD